MIVAVYKDVQLRPRDATSFVLHQLRLCASTAEGKGSMPGWGTDIPQAMLHGQNIKKKNRIQESFS